MNQTAAVSVCVHALLVTVVLSAASAQAQFEELAAKIPPSANAIVLLDAGRLLDSPLSKREGWKERYDQAFAAGMVTISPDTHRLILAAQMDYEFMEPQWRLAVADLSKTRSAVEVARITKGTLDPFGNTPAVALRENAYAVELGPKRVAAMYPANRQSIARWLREIQGRTAPALSPYLKGTLVASQQSAVVMAFDLEDAIPPDIVRAKLAASPAVKAKNIDVAAAAKALDGVRGIVLEVAVTDASSARLMVHFRDDSSVLAPIAKPLLQELLAGLGATIDDVEGWTAQSEPQRIVFQGPLTEAGRKRVLSLVDNPLASLLAAESAETSSANRQVSQVAAATQQYFKALTSIISEIREKSKDSKTLGENALWFDKWARRIDSLPVLNVDKELVDFGQYVTTQLRNMSAALRGVGIRSGARTAQVWDSSSVYSNGYSYYAEARDADPERRAIRAQERAAGATSARGNVQEIENALAKVRKDLTQKYQVEF